MLTILEEAGFEAFIIGGAVRDMLMHVKPHDFDIVTSARPEQVISVLDAAGIETTGIIGKSFGVVVAIVDGKHYEVATYRKERYGADSHRPEEIIYADTLVEDVKRRDFTVNGMAMNRNKEVIDLVGGRRFSIRSFAPSGIQRNVFKRMHCDYLERADSLQSSIFFQIKPY